MYLILLIVSSKTRKFSHRVLLVPEKHLIQEFPSNRLNQSLNKRIRCRRTRDALDFLNMATHLKKEQKLSGSDPAPLVLVNGVVRLPLRSY